MRVYVKGRKNVLKVQRNDYELGEIWMEKPGRTEPSWELMNTIEAGLQSTSHCCKLKPEDPRAATTHPASGYLQRNSLAFVSFQAMLLEPDRFWRRTGGGWVNVGCAWVLQWKKPLRFEV